jgi:myo-inositol-1-phosphate synthase
MTDNKIRVAIVGVGNCASALVQGLEFYKDAPSSEKVPGLMHVRLGPYHVRDIDIVTAFDVDGKKVGKDVAEAIFTEPNNTIRFADVPPLSVDVLRGPTLDGLGQYYRQEITESDAEPVEVAAALREHRVEVVVNYLPVGSEIATRHYAQAALEAGCAFVNCMPVFISSDREWARRFVDAGLPILGDDIKSQVGSTIVHRVLTKLLEDRGVKLDKTYQLNFGGNMDFENMLERERLTSKKISKTQSVQSQLRKSLPQENIHIGPSDYVPWLKDRKWAQIRLEGTSFGDAPLSIELKLEVWDSPNSAGIVIDAIRCCRLALDRGMSGPLIGPSAYFMKSPPVQFSDDAAREMVEEFILGNGASKAADWTSFFDAHASS